MKLRVAADRRNKPRAHNPEYTAYMQSAEWQERRKLILARAGGRCETCGADRPLEVHHKTYKRFQAEPLEDLIALCPPCHDKADEERARQTRSRVYYARVRGFADKIYGGDNYSDADFDAAEEKYARWAERKGHE